MRRSAIGQTKRIGLGNAGDAIEGLGGIALPCCVSTLDRVRVGLNLNLVATSGKTHAVGAQAAWGDALAAVAPGCSKQPFY